MRWGKCHGSEQNLKKDQLARLARSTQCKGEGSHHPEMGRGDPAGGRKKLLKHERLIQPGVPVDVAKVLLNALYLSHEIRIICTWIYRL